MTTIPTTRRRPRARSDRGRRRCASAGDARCSTPRSCGGRSATRSCKLDPAPHGAQPGDVRRRDRQRAHDDPVLPRPAASTAARQRVRRPRRRCGCGSRCCSPTSPRPWPRAGARRRPTRCARPRSETVAYVRRADGTIDEQASSRARRSATSASSSAGELIPGDGDVIEGIASVDESAITGESAPVIRESGGDRSAVTGGTRVLSDQIVVRITSKPGETLPRPDDRARRRAPSGRRRPNEIALNILLAGPHDHLPARRRSPCSRSRSTRRRRAVDRSCWSRCSCA